MSRYDVLSRNSSKRSLCSGTVFMHMRTENYAHNSLARHGSSINEPAGQFFQLFRILSGCGPYKRLHTNKNQKISLPDLHLSPSFFTETAQGVKMEITPYLTHIEIRQFKFLFPIPMNTNSFLFKECRDFNILLNQIFRR